MAQQDSRKLETTKTPGVYRRGDRYIVRWKFRGRSHKRHFATYAEAREFKRTLGGQGKQPTTRQTVAGYGETWIDSYRGRTARGLDEATRAQYRRSLERHIAPARYLGGVMMRDLGSRDISYWFGTMERDGVPPATIRKAKAALSAMLATAAQDGAIQYNPALGVRYVPAPAIAERERLAQGERKRRTLSADQVLAIIAAMPEPWHVFFSLLAESGCRISELIGLRWENVHLGDEPHIYVCEQWKDGRYKRLKTDASEDPIPLSPPMAQWLGQMRPHDASGPVFPSKTGMPLGYSNLYNRVLLPAAETAGEKFPPRRAFHAFRDACARRVGRHRPRREAAAPSRPALYVHGLREGNARRAQDGGHGGDPPMGPPWGHRTPANSRKRCRRRGRRFRSGSDTRRRPQPPGLTHNPSVAGSIPARPTREAPRRRGFSVRGQSNRQLWVTPGATPKPVTGRRDTGFMNAVTKVENGSGLLTVPEVAQRLRCPNRTCGGGSGTGRFRRGSSAGADRPLVSRG